MDIKIKEEINSEEEINSPNEEEGSKSFLRVDELVAIKKKRLVASRWLRLSSFVADALIYYSIIFWSIVISITLQWEEFKDAFLLELWQQHLQDHQSVEEVIVKQIDAFTSIDAFIIMQIIVLVMSLLLLFINIFYMLEGQTIGKKLQGIHVIKYSSDEIKVAGFWRYFCLRFLFGICFLTVIPFWFLINILFIFREDRRCLHDLIAGTQVIVKNETSFTKNEVTISRP